MSRNNFDVFDDLGAWEKHTKGIGRKYLTKFGFTGRLGANEDGISQPLELEDNRHRIGLGYGSSKLRERERENHFG